MILPLAKSPPIGGEARDAARGRRRAVARQGQGGRAAVLRLQPGVGKFRTPSRADADSEKMRPLSASSGGLQKRKAQQATGRSKALADCP